MIVERGVGAELLAHDARLLGRARRADHAQPPALRELHHHRADGARGPGDEDRLTRFRLGDDAQAGPGREPRAAERAQIRLGRNARGVDHARALRGNDRELAPALIVQHRRAERYLRCARGDHRSDRRAAQRLADDERRHVRLRVVHPPAHVRLDRHQRVLDEHLAFARRPEVRGGEREVRVGRLAAGTAREPDLPAAHGVALRRHAGRFGEGGGVTPRRPPRRCLR